MADSGAPILYTNTSVLIDFLDISRRLESHAAVAFIRKRGQAWPMVLIQ